METNANFKEVTRHVAAQLADEGYTIVDGEAQEWGHRFSLSRGRQDGAVSLFLGPIREEDGKRTLPYRLAWETVWNGEVDLVDTEDPCRIAALFVQHITESLGRHVQSPSEIDPGVGAGLIPVGAPAAQITHSNGGEAPGEESTR